MANKKDYGTASPEEIIKGIELATELANKIREVHSVAVRDMIKKLIALINID